MTSAVGLYNERLTIGLSDFLDIQNWLGSLYFNWITNDII